MTDPSSRRADLVRIFQFRHAAKKFQAQRLVAPEDFEALLEVTRLSPTSFGFEPWRLVVVQDPALRERLRAVTWGAQGQLPTASHFVVFTVLRGDQLAPRGEYLTQHLTEVKKLTPDRLEGMQTKFAAFLADEVKLTTPEEVTGWAARQAYIAVGNLMTAAAYLGIDSCPIEGFHQGQFEAILDGHGGYDQGTHAAVCCVALGYRAEEPRPRVRKAPEATVGWA